MAADDGRSIPIMTMGPICIAPELKRKGYGKILLDYSLEKAKELGCGTVCFEGNIDFYGKSGFKQASEFGIRYHGLPEGEDASFFLCKELIPGYLNGITGSYAQTHFPSSVANCAFASSKFFLSIVIVRYLSCSIPCLPSIIFSSIMSL